MESKDSKAVAQAPAPEPLCNWTGFYIGLHGGYVHADGTSSEVFGVDSYNFNANEFYGGGQLGYNRQFGSWLVLGVEGEFAGTSIDQSTTLIANDQTIETGRLKNDWTGAISGRVGISLLQNKLLAYLKGGVAFARMSFDINDPEPGQNPDRSTFRDEEIMNAGLLGAGVEYAFSCHWSAKLEYKHLFFGREDFRNTEKHFDQGGTKLVTYKIDGDQDLVEVGLNYKF